MKTTVEYCMWKWTWIYCSNRNCLLFRCFSHCTIIVSFITDVCLLVEHGACTQNALDDIYMFSWHQLGLQQTSCGYRSYSCLKTSLTKWEIFSGNWFVCKMSHEWKIPFLFGFSQTQIEIFRLHVLCPKTKNPTVLTITQNKGEQSPQNWPVGLVSCYFFLKEDSLIGFPK